MLFSQGVGGRVPRRRQRSAVAPSCSSAFLMFDGALHRPLCLPPGPSPAHSLRDCAPRLQKARIACALTLVVVTLSLVHRCGNAWASPLRHLHVWPSTATSRLHPLPQATTHWHHGLRDGGRWPDWPLHLEGNRAAVQSGRPSDRQWSVSGAVLHGVPQVCMKPGGAVGLQPMGGGRPRL